MNQILLKNILYSLIDNNVNDLRDLLDSIEDVNINKLVFDTLDSTLLHMAVTHSNYDIIVMLCTNYNVNIFLTDKLGWSIIHLAAHLGRKEVIKYLLLQQGDVNLEDNDGNLPIHYAIYSGHNEIVELLLMFGCDIIPHHNSAYLLALDRLNFDLVKLFKPLSMLDNYD